MREIKFRGKDKQTGTWRIGHLIQNESSTWIGNTTAIRGWFEVDPESVGQYTGSKDKNGKEIYESDLVEDNVGVGFVEFLNGAYRVNYRDGFCKWFIDFLDSEKKQLEVIGNIYENPELPEQP